MTDRENLTDSVLTSDLLNRIERLHAHVESLCNRFKGYLPWPDDLRTSTVRSHEMFIKDTLTSADVICLGAEKTCVDSTPRTEAHLSHLNLPDGRKIGIPNQTVELLRQLERELAEAKPYPGVLGDAKLGQACEGLIALKTNFTGEPPYVGNDGVLLALREALDELAELRAARSTFGNSIEAMRIERDALAKEIGK